MPKTIGGLDVVNEFTPLYNSLVRYIESMKDSILRKFITHSKPPVLEGSSLCGDELEEFHLHGAKEWVRHYNTLLKQGQELYNAWATKGADNPDVIHAAENFITPPLLMNKFSEPAVELAPSDSSENTCYVVSGDVEYDTDDL